MKTVSGRAELWFIGQNTDTTVSRPHQETHLIVCRLSSQLGAFRWFAWIRGTVWECIQFCTGNSYFSPQPTGGAQCGLWRWWRCHSLRQGESSCFFGPSWTDRFSPKLERNNLILLMKLGDAYLSSGSSIDSLVMHQDQNIPDMLGGLTSAVFLPSAWLTVLVSAGIALIFLLSR